MLVKYHAVAIVPILTVLSFVLWNDWSTFLNAPITVGQMSILLTIAVANRAEKFAKIYERCYVHSGSYINNRNCAIAVRSETTYWGLGLTALARFNGRFKRDVKVRPDQDIIMVGNQTMIHITVFETASKHDSDMGNVRFWVGEERFVYLNANITGLTTGDSNLLMVSPNSRHEHNYLETIIIAEVTNNGSIGMLPMFPASIRASDGIVGNYFVHGAGSIIMECEYGDGLSGTLYDTMGSWYADLGNMMNYDYEQLHAFRGNREAMRCCINQYDHMDRTWRTWRDWDDVWESF